MLLWVLFLPAHLSQKFKSIVFSLPLVELSVQRQHSFFTNEFQIHSCRIHLRNHAPTSEWECHPIRLGLWVAFLGTALNFSQKTECVYFWVKHFSCKLSSKHQWFHGMFRFESSNMTVSLSIPKHAVEFNRWFLKMNIKIGRLFSFFHFTPIALSGFCFTFRDLSKAQTCYVAFNVLGTTGNQFFSSDMKLLHICSFPVKLELFIARFFLCDISHSQFLFSILSYCDLWAHTQSVKINAQLFCSSGNY